MTQPLTEASLSLASQCVEARLGLHFPPSRWRELERGLEGASRDLGLSGSREGVEQLTRGALSRDQIHVLASHLTIGETYFFREPAAFQALETLILPDLIRRRAESRRLRIWCAGCSTGEEPYSLAMVLDRLLPGFETWNITLLATDINPGFLRRARTGVYKEWSFRDRGDSIKPAYFRQLPNGHYELNERLRARVRFDCLNLAEDAFPSLLTNTNALDLILCRNVLMYFSQDRMRETIARLHMSLVEGGYLVVSATEASQQLFRGFRPVPTPGAVVYAKEPQVGAFAPMDAVPKAVREDDPARASNGGRSPARHREASAPAQWGKIEANYERGQISDAESATARLLRRHPGHAGALALRARLAANQGRLDEALDWCDRSLAARSTSVATHHLRASILEELGRFSEARDALRHGLSLDPEFVLAHFGLGHLALRANRQDAAHVHFRDAMNLLSKLPDSEMLPESDGMTAGRLAEIIRALDVVSS